MVSSYLASLARPFTYSASVPEVEPGVKAAAEVAIIDAAAVAKVMSCMVGKHEIALVVGKQYEQLQNLTEF